MPVAPHSFRGEKREKRRKEENYSTFVKGNKERQKRRVEKKRQTDKTEEFYWVGHSLRKEEVETDGNVERERDRRRRSDSISCSAKTVVCP